MPKKNNPAQASAPALDKYLTVSDVATMLGVSEQLVHKLLKERRLAHSRIGRRIIIRLRDVEALCSRVLIINHGRLVRVAPVAELLDAPGEFEIKVDAPDDLVVALRLQPWGQEARVEHGLVITRAPDARGRNLIAFLVENGHHPDSVSERQRDLEDIFLSLTGGDS